ncbi:hypothetical protein [Acanthopleuribacter pedis]|uniref:Uncharacterized protein n=1 Tax=Acanthopleuribacter pedis TaxID=442870 RepID=A0A8J7Q749_9BACT|nr:hypothetical protein [Acanthopleuribacter pedis]MBO1319501.1 hypothetical protein [Acanthopleuribacter pedis]
MKFPRRLIALTCAFLVAGFSLPALADFNPKKPQRLSEVLPVVLKASVMLKDAFYQGTASQAAIQDNKLYTPFCGPTYIYEVPLSENLIWTIEASPNTVVLSWRGQPSEAVGEGAGELGSYRLQRNPKDLSFEERVVLDNAKYHIDLLHWQSVFNALLVMTDKLNVLEQQRALNFSPTLVGSDMYQIKACETEPSFLFQFEDNGHLVWSLQNLDNVVSNTDGRFISKGYSIGWEIPRGTADARGIRRGGIVIHFEPDIWSFPITIDQVTVE